MINLLRGARQKLARLRPVRVPDAPSRPFRDLWPGDAARGARLLRGEADFAGTIRPSSDAERRGFGRDAAIHLQANIAARGFNQPAKFFDFW